MIGRRPRRLSVGRAKGVPIGRRRLDPASFQSHGQVGPPAAIGRTGPTLAAAIGQTCPTGPIWAAAIVRTCPTDPALAVAIVRTCPTDLASVAATGQRDRTDPA